MNIENNVKDDLFNLVKEYFEVFDDKFLAYERLNRYVQLFIILIFLLVILFFFSVGFVDKLTYDSVDYYELLLNVLAFICICSMFLLFFYSYKHSEFRKKESIFKDGRICFCYLFRSFSFLQKYLNSNIKDQLNEGKKSFAKYQIETYLKGELKIEFVAGNDKMKLNILDFSKKYPNKYFWLKLDGESEKILKSLNSAKGKIAHRINEGFEIDIILPALKNLLLFEYATLNADKSFANGLVGDYSEGLLLDYVSELDKLDLPKRKIKQQVKRKNNVKLRINALLHNRNILFSIIFWFIILLIVFGIALLMAQQYFSIAMDSKILIGLITAPFAGAIAISMTLHNKR